MSRVIRTSVLSLLAIAVALAGLTPANARAQETIQRVPYGGSAPLSRAVVVGNTIYLSGALGTVPGEGLVDGGIEAETRQTIENIAATLESLDSGLEDVVKCTVFLADFAEWGAMNRVYAEYFGAAPPARSAVAVSGLAVDARVEIECIAVRGTR